MVTEVRRAGFRALIAGLIAAIAVSGTFVGVSIYEDSLTPAAPPTVSVNLSVSNSTFYTTAPNFLGVNLRANYPMGPQGAAVANTGIRFVRWPGGGLADRTDVLAANGSGLIYEGLPAPVPAATSAADFVSWCLANGCRAIIDLPGEINSPSYAAAEVGYFVNVLHFEPAYWEVGNEPAIWTHWSYPWIDWQPGQNSTPSPLQYAHEVAAYIGAVRAANSSSPVLGLPGTGTGSVSDSEWIGATVYVNSGEISSLAIHVFPVGAEGPNDTTQELFATLEGPNSLPTVLGIDQEAIRINCGGCQVAILVDEAGMESSVTGAAPSFPWVLYESVLILQGAEANLSGLVFWDSQGTYPGSWLSSTGAPQLTYQLFHALPATFPSRAYPVEIRSSMTGLYALYFGATPSQPAMFWLVNVNTSVAAGIDLAQVLPPASGGVVLTWSAGTAAPVRHSGSSTRWTVPPESLLIWEQAA